MIGRQILALLSKNVGRLLKLPHEMCRKAKNSLIFCESG
jgi:hypothetical protein